MDALSVRPLLDAEAGACAALMAGSDPWVTLGIGEATCLRGLQDPCLERYGAHLEGRLAGVLVLNLQGALAGYLQTLCVAPGFRGLGVGAALVAFAEARILAGHPNVFLCVSAFNAGARRFYGRLGYAEVGTLKNYLVAGQDEILMRKSRGPKLP